jgi:hypothetical protein
MSAALWWCVEDLMRELGVGKRTVHGWTAARSIPCRRISHTRRVVFLPDEIARWVDAGGSLPLEVDDLPGGGFAVRPKEPA